MASSKPILLSNNKTTYFSTGRAVKNLWCRDAYWSQIISQYGFNPFTESNGSHLRKCTWGDNNRKIAKENKINNKVDIIPCFYLSNDLEDIAWALSRITIECQIEKIFRDKIKYNRKVTIWDMCLATGINCKDGYHNVSEKLCIDDFMTGRCHCINFMEYSEKVLKLQSELDEINSRDKVKAKIKNAQIKKLNDYINSRSIHYTDQIKSNGSSNIIDTMGNNFIPFAIQLEKYRESIKSIKQVIVEECCVIEPSAKPIKKIVKPGFGK